MRRVLTLIVCCVALSFTASAQLKFGAGINILNDLGVQGKVHNTFSEKVAGQGSFTYFFVSNATVWNLDLDVHYSGFDIGDVESFALTPFAGFNVFGVSAFGISTTDIGLNIGINGTMPLSGMQLYIEPKIVINNGTDFAIAAGVYF